MSIPDLVPVLDIELFEGISFDLAFIAEIMNVDGTSQVPPVYYDFTDKAVVLILTGIFREDFFLSSADGESPDGSILIVDPDPTTGKFQYSLTSNEVKRANKNIGYQHLLVQETGMEDEVLARGTVRILPFQA
jgi:hypothetical protein